MTKKIKHILKQNPGKILRWSSGRAKIGLIFVLLMGLIIPSVMLFVFPEEAHAVDVAFDAATLSEGTGTQTFNHTITGSAPALLVFVSSGKGTAPDVTGITYAGNALTFVRQDSNGTLAQTEVWKLAAPPTGTNSVVVTVTGSPDPVFAVAMSFTGADQSDPVSNHGGATGASDPATVTITSATGEMVADNYAETEEGGVSAGAGQTQRWLSSSVEPHGRGSTEPGATSVTMSWPGIGTDWAISAVSIKKGGAEVGTLGTQTATLSTNKAAQYVGGVFTITEQSSSRNVTGITIAETGTVDALNNLDNIKLKYDLDTTAPYDCASESYAASDTQFGATDTTGFSAANGTSAFTGTVSITTTQTMCVYVELDTVSATDSQTLLIQITNPSTDVTVSAGSVSPTTAVAISGSTTLSNLAPDTPILGATPAFDDRRTLDDTPVLGSFSSVDNEGDAVEYEIQWDTDFNFGTPPVTNNSVNFSTNGFTAATFTSAASVSYTVGAGEALTNNQTFWWRVRARDPAGSNTFSAYSSKRSITIDTGLSIDRWFQTQDNQFSGSTFVDTEVSGSGGVKILGF